MLRREIPGRDEARAPDARSRAEPAIGIGEHVQALLGRDPREVADRERLLSPRRPGRVAIQVDAERHEPHLLARDAEIARHVVEVVPADRQERVDVRAGRADQIHRLLLPGLAEAVEEQVLALQRAADRRLQRPLERFGEPEQQRVGQVDDVEPRLGLQPVEQLRNLLALEALVAAQHRDGHLAEALRIDLDLTLRRELDDPFGVPQAIEHARRVPEDGRVLLEEHADAAEHDVMLADVALVGPRRRIHRRQHDVVPAGHERRRERVVAQAAPAVHLSGAAGERQDSQELPRSPVPCLNRF